MKCPGCDHEVKILLEQQPEPDNMTATTSLVNNMVYDGTYQVTYAPTKEVFKCCNEKCWVTKIEVNWG